VAAVRRGDDGRVTVGGVRFAGLFALAACGGATATPSVPARPAATRHIAAHEPIDVLAALSETGREVSFIVPGSAQLELGAAVVQAPDGSEPLEVVPLDDRGNDVRVGVRLEHVRFALWTQRARMLAIVARDQRVEERASAGFSAYSAEPIEARLRATALVRRLGHEDHWTRIRYLGALEINGWVPDDALVDRTPAGKATTGRVPTGRTTLSVFPGIVIRSEPKWTARELAVMATGYFVDHIRDVDDAWVEVGYEDGDVYLHGFVSRRDPPGRIHHPREADAPALVAPNAIAPSGTCLYASEAGEPIGYIVGDRQVALDATHAGWFALSIDTPWGPLTFSARGATENELVACAPPGSVPAPSPPPAPVAP
jgi:hypothetical protein